MLNKPHYKKLDLQVFATFFEIYSGKASASTRRSRAALGSAGVLRSASAFEGV